VDTTAAGDVFNGALALLSRRQALPDAVRFANAAGAISVTRLGAQPSAPKRAEIEADGWFGSDSRGGGRPLNRSTETGRQRAAGFSPRGPSNRVSRRFPFRLDLFRG